MTFGTPIALLGLLVIPAIVALADRRGAPPQGAGSRVRDARARRGVGPGASSHPQAAAVRPRARGARGADRRSRPAAGHALGSRAAGDRHPRARYLPLDDRDRREAVTARGRRCGRAHIPRRRARRATRSASSRSRRGPRSCWPRRPTARRPGRRSTRSRSARERRSATRSTAPSPRRGPASPPTSRRRRMHRRRPSSCSPTASRPPAAS